MDDAVFAEHRLIGGIYDAMLDNTLMPGVMASIAELTDSDTAGFVAFDTLNPAYSLLFNHGFAAEMLTELLQGGYHLLQFQVMGTMWMNTLEVGTPSCSDRFWGGVEAYQAAGGAYVEFINRHGLYHQAPITFERSDFRSVGLGLNNGRGKPFSDATLELLRRIAPHFRRALQIHRQLSYLDKNNTALYAMLDQMPTGVLLLSSDLHLRYANPYAEHLLQDQCSLKVSAAQLSATNARKNAQLQQLLRSAMETSQRACKDSARHDHGGVLSLEETDDRTALMLTVTPLSELAEYRDLASDNIAAAIFLTSPTQARQLSEKLLRESYGLSAREIEICQDFVNSPVLQTVASNKKLALESVRSHMKNIYEKTGQHSQAELVRLLMGLRVNFEHIA